MSWVAVGVAGGSALLSGMQASKQAKQQAATQKANMLANAAQMQYSPWSGMSASFMPGQAVEDPTSAALGAGLQGGLKGAMFGQQFSKGMSEKQGPVTSDGGSPDAVGLGGKGYAAQLGQQGNDFLTGNTWGGLAQKESIYSTPQYSLGGNYQFRPRFP